MPKKSQEKNILQVHFGKTIRELRHKSDLTQEQLAEKSGVDRSYLADLESGGRNISLKNILKLAKGLKIEPDQLIRFFLNQLDKQKADWKTFLDESHWTERG